MPQLDGLRFLAFFLVFIHHLPLAPVLGKPGLWPEIVISIREFGWMGVELFFCLSAFLMTHLMLIEFQRRGSISIYRFYLRRIFRIWPLYLFAVFLGFVLFPLLELPFSPPMGSIQYEKMVAEHLLPLLLFIENVSAALNGYPSSTALNLLWSISAEEQFYLILPLLISLFVTRSLGFWMALLLGVSLFGLGVRAALLFMESPHPTIWVIPIARPDSFLIGILLAFLSASGHLDSLKSGSWQGMTAAALGVFACAAATSFPNLEAASWHTLWQYPAISLGFGLILLSLCIDAGGRLSRFLANPVFVWLGRISYGLYVYHFLAIYGMRKVLGKLEEAGILFGTWETWFMHFLGSLVSVIVVSAVSYRYLEKPFLKLKTRFELVHSRTP